MPEFIPKARTPDELARFVLEMQSKIPHTGQYVAEGISSIAKSLMDRIKEKQAADAAQSLEVTKGMVRQKEAPQKSFEDMKLAYAKADENYEFDEEKASKFLKAIDPTGKSGISSLPVTDANFQQLYTRRQKETKFFDPVTGKVTAVSADAAKQLYQPRSIGVGGMEALVTLFKQLSTKDKEKITQGEIPPGLVDFFKRNGVEVEYQASYFQQLKDWLTGEQTGKFMAKDVIPPGENLNVAGKKPKNFVQPQKQEEPNSWVE